jgi:DHA1 family multidrug resistance protein-like MFS transporter
VPKDRMARTLGIFYGAFNVGVVGGALFGGVIASLFGLASPLFAYAGILVLAGGLFLRFVPDPHLAGRPADPPLSTEEVLVEREGPVKRWGGAKVVDLLRQRAFVTTIVTNMAYLWFIAGVFDALLPLFGHDGLGMSTRSISVVLAIALAAEFVVLYPAGSLADRIGRKPVMVPALAGLAIMVTLLGWAGSPLIYALLMVPLGLASGVAGVPPAAMLSDVVPERASGTAVGVFRFCGDLGFVFGPLLAGWAAKSYGFKAAFAVSALPAAVACLLVLTTPETLKRSADADAVPGAPHHQHDDADQ